MALFHQDFDFAIQVVDLRDYDNLPPRWRRSCVRMAAIAFQMNVNEFSDRLGDDDDSYMNQLLFECISLRLAMGWFVFSELADPNNMLAPDTPDISEAVTLPRDMNNID